MGNSALPASAWRLAAGVPWGDMPLKYDLGDLRDTGAAVAVTLFRPSEDRAVLVVAASDQAAVEARLRPQLGVLLCVVPSRWTKAQLDEIRDYLWERREQWQLSRMGTTPHRRRSGPHRPPAWRECCRRSPPGLTRFRTESWLLTHGSPLSSRPLPYQVSSASWLTCVKPGRDGCRVVRD